MQGFREGFSFGFGIQRLKCLGFSFLLVVDVGFYVSASDSLPASFFVFSGFEDPGFGV